MRKKRENREIVWIILAIFFILFVLFFFQNKNLTGLATYESQPNSSDGKDTYIRENYTAQAFGDQASLKIGKTGGPIDLKAILEFNISSIQQGYTITSGIVQIYTNYSSTGANVTINAYRVTAPWEEANANWVNSTSTSPWATAGGDYDPTAVYSVVFTNITERWYNFTITDLARGWNNGTYPNYGIILIALNAGSGDWKEIYSSDFTSTLFAPKILVDYTANAAPTLSNITTNSNLTNLKKINENIIFGANWTDIDSAQAQLFICNSSGISKTGCESLTFCNTSLSANSFLNCNYTVQTSDNRSSPFWAAVCDGINCSSVLQDYFYMNHAPNITLLQPDGGETINQSLGNYIIRFNVSDRDSPDRLFADVYYGLTQNSTAHLINSSLNLTQICTDKDFKITTQNNCSYLWNTTGIYGSYFITIIVNDSYETSSDFSNSSFNVYSLADDQAPTMNATWISDNYITSGKIIQLYANISDANLNSVWVSVNTTPQQNITMRNLTSQTYNASFTSPQTGAYTFTVYATDVIGNMNISTPQEFNVTKPVANVQSINSPPSTLPYHVIRISSEMNATDLLRGVSAYLYVPDGFTFLSGYPQNTNSQNFSENETKTLDWMVSAPLAESNYSMNITYTDKYSNNWNSSTVYVAVNSSIAGQGQGSAYFIDLAGYPEVETSKSYYIEADFKNNGIPTQADSAGILIYDPLGSLIVGPASMSNPSTGKYNYSYTLGISANEGQWQTIVNLTKSSVSYYATQFWKVVGGPFDVRNISIENSAIGSLRASIVAENTGGVTKDLTLTWNLTRTDNNLLLDSGAETFAVDAYSNKTWTVYPETDYVGQVKIIFVGQYSGTEKAGAFKTFSTTPAQNATTPAGTSGGSGGGSGGTTVQTLSKDLDLEITADKEVYISQSMKKTVQVEVKNTGKKDLTNVILKINGLDSKYYAIIPSSIKKIKSGEKSVFNIEFLGDDSLTDRDLIYIVHSDETEKSLTVKLMVLGLKEYFFKEINYLKGKLAEIKSKLKSDTLIKSYQGCEKMVTELEDYLKKEQYLDIRDNLDKASKCIIDLKSQMEIEQIETQPIKVESYTLWGITWVLIALVILLMAFILYIIYKKMNVLNFVNKSQGAVSAGKEKRNIKSSYFDDRIKEIKKKLDEEDSTEA